MATNYQNFFEKDYQELLKKYDLKIDSLDNWIEYKVSRTESRLKSNE